MSKPLDFTLDERALTASLANGDRNTDHGPLLATAARGAVLDLDAIAALWLDSRLATETLVDAARERRGARARHLETFSPLYLTNTCDAACRVAA